MEETKPGEEINEEQLVQGEKTKEKNNKFISFIKRMQSKKNTFLLLSILIVLIILVVIVLSIINRKEDQVEIKVKSTLEKIVEKSDLETINIAYNVIAKQCRDLEECDKSSNNIDDFYYVASCKGTITAGIDFKEVKIEVDEKNKKVTIIMPEATIKGEPSIGTIKFLNGDEISANELPNARKLCQETTIEKSKADGELIPASKEQARIVLEEFYKQWIKAYDDSYVIEVK